MTWHADNITSAESMQTWLASKLFPKSRTTVRTALADRWEVGMQNGHEYLTKHGLYVLAKAADEVRSGRQAFSSVIAADLRSDTLGVPVAEYSRCKIFDDCCNASELDMDLFHIARRSNVVTQDALHLVYPELTPEPVQESSDLQESPGDTDASVAPDVADAVADTQQADGIATPPKTKRAKRGRT